MQAAQPGSLLDSREPRDDSENESSEDVDNNSDVGLSRSLRHFIHNLKLILITEVQCAPETGQLDWLSDLSPSSELSDRTYYEPDGPPTSASFWDHENHKPLKRTTETGYTFLSPEIPSISLQDAQLISNFDMLLHHLVPNSQRLVNIPDIFPELDGKSRTNVFCATSHSRCSDDINKNSDIEEMLIDMVHSVNDSIASVSLDIASVIPPRLLKMRRPEFYMTEYQNECLKGRCIGTNGVQLAIQCKLNGLLFDSIFAPFAPGLDTDMSNGLLSIYGRLKDSNFGEPTSR